jgi:hypothetical protein
MKQSLRHLISGAIDYAGMFPPAVLSLEQAAANFAEYRQSPEAWMLGRFVCPATRLGDLAELKFGSTAPVSALSTASGGPTEYVAQLARDVEHARRYRSVGVCDTFELRLPAEVLEPGGVQMLRSFLHDCVGVVRVLEAAVFVELPAMAVETPVVRPADVGLALRAIREVLDEDRTVSLGFKARTGGVMARAFPTAHDLAAAICQCRRVGVFWKATAGLHHPLRHFDRSLGCAMHGFLNVLVASVLDTVHQLEVDQVAEILSDENQASFHFADDGLRWRDLAASNEQIAAARRTALVSFGSCSFDEPRTDLRALSLL